MERALLLVDDEENIIRSLRRLLRRDGYTILTAASGQEGLEVLKKFEVGVIISDQRMPEMTGVQFLRQVKEIYPDTVRIVLSGHTDLNTVTDAVNEGAIFKFFSKPWDDDLLRKNVTEAFQHFELSYENEQLRKRLKQSNEDLHNANLALKKHLERQGQTVNIQHRTLQISEEILENLPLGVIGISNNGIIALANHRAVELLLGHSGKLVDCDAEQILPAAVIEAINNVAGNPIQVNVTLSNDVDCEILITPLGHAATASGVILTLTTR